MTAANRSSPECSASLSIAALPLNTATTALPATSKVLEATLIRAARWGVEKNMLVGWFCGGRAKER